MKNRITFFLVTIFFLFVFVILYKGLSNSNLYSPKTNINKIPEFNTEIFLKKITVNSLDVFNKENFYLLNIWASWCVPCRDEHTLLINLSKNKKIEIIGLNYKDNLNNAKKFIKELGNPYSVILLDKDGTNAIEWGAFGVPESFLIYDNKIIKRYTGPLNLELIDEIESYIK